MVKKDKKRLTKEEEFQIMKLVLDKFLLLGALIMFTGFLFLIGTSEPISYGFTILASGAVLMLIFAFLMVKEYQFLNH